MADVVQGLVELFDDGHLLIVKHDLVVVDYFKHRLSGKQTQVAVLLVRVYDLEQPEDSGWVDYVFLVRGFVLDVKVDDIYKLVEYASILGVQKGLENVHEEFLIEFVQL